MLQTDFDMISFGAGVNSVALAVEAIKHSWRGYIVMADTGCEQPETLCYIQYFQEYLRPYGMEIIVMDARADRTWDKRASGKTLIEYCEARLLIPLIARRWCTQYWKVLPMEKWQEAHGIAEDRVALGIAADERRRRPDMLRPLVDEGITREDCIQIIQAAGLDVPQKSGCYICPFQARHQWRALWERHPDLYARAEALEAEVTKKRHKNATFDPDGKVTLYWLRYGFEHQIELPMIDRDALLRFKPCICTL